MCHVLIIEDEALVALEIQMVLEQIGATSFAFAQTEEDAIIEARAKPPAMITSDVRLAQGHGPNAVRRIEHEHGSIPAIYITGSPDECIGCAPDAILEKPLEPALLIRSFRRLALV